MAKNNYKLSKHNYIFFNFFYLSITLWFFTFPDTLKDSIKSPTRPLSSASEQSGGSGRVGSTVARRLRSSPRKPRPVSIAGTVPDSKPQTEKISPLKKPFVANKKPVAEVKKGE